MQTNKKGGYCIVRIIGKDKVDKRGFRIMLQDPITKIYTELRRTNRR